MKKTISLALVFSFIFALALQMPALAEVSATSTASDTSNEPSLTSVNHETSTPEIKTEAKIEAPRLLTASSTPGVPSNLEKIPSPEYVKFFREVRKINDTLFGIRRPAAEIEKLKQESPQIKNPEPLKNTSTSSLEKIASPAHISLFEKITKIGNDLFGIKKVNSEIKAPVAKATSTLENKLAGLEKITSLNDVKLFEKITKIGNDLFGIRKKGAYTLPTMSAELIACASSAIDTKDSKISAAFTASAAEITNAISARGTCQKAALALSAERQGALNACNKAFNEAHKAAIDKVKNTQKEAWSTYNANLKTCATSANTSEIKIEDGGQSITEALNQ